MAGSGETAVPSLRNEKGVNMIPDESLAEMFAVLNHDFFDGKLPPHKLYWRKFAVGRGLHVKRPPSIILHPKLKRTPEELRRVLLHEMCHFNAHGHGRAFCNNLLRLANKGETWVWKQHESQKRKWDRISDAKYLKLDKEQMSIECELVERRA